MFDRRTLRRATAGRTHRELGALAVLGSLVGCGVFGQDFYGFGGQGGSVGFGGGSVADSGTGGPSGLGGAGGGSSVMSASTVAASAVASSVSSSVASSSVASSSASGGCVASPESCNGKDDDCNGLVDDLPRNESATSSSFGATVTAIAFEGGKSYVTVKPGQAIKATLSFSIKDTCLPGCTCIDQLLVGFAAESPQQCAYDGTPGCAQGVTGTVTLNLTAPTVAGPHALSIDRSQDYGCALAKVKWWNNPIPMQVGSVCVVP